jgi:lipoprotein-anchoring transpeptidase ErfK/SrfK
MTRLLRLFLYLCLLIGLGFIAASLYSPMRPLPPPPPLTGEVDRIVIEKGARRMQLFQEGKPVRVPTGSPWASRPTATRSGRATARRPKANRCAPTGSPWASTARRPKAFTIDRRNSESAFHLSVGLDYPRPEDIERAAKGGYSPGGDIFIHGQPNALPDGLKIKGDWTAGCIAVSNAEMREIWAVTPVGTTVEIRP